MFETSCNLVTIWGETEVDIAHQWGLNCTGIAASSHLQQKLHLRCSKNRIKNRMCKPAFINTFTVKNKLHKGEDLLFTNRCKRTVTFIQRSLVKQESICSSCDELQGK